MIDIDFVRTMYKIFSNFPRKLNVSSPHDYYLPKNLKK